MISFATLGQSRVIVSQAERARYIVICINPAFTKMIDGTEKPKIPLNFAKHAAQYNKFCCKTSRKIEFISVQARGGLIQSRGAYNQVYFSFCLLSNGGSIFTAITCISHVPSLLKSKFQKDYEQEETICEHFRF